MLAGSICQVQPTSGFIKRVKGGTMTDIAMEAGTFRLADVFSKAFTIYGRRFVPFIILTIIASIPNYIAVFAFGSMPGSRVPASLSAGPVILILVDIATKSLAGGAVIYGVVQELRGRAFSVGDSIQIALNRVLPMLGVALCSTIAIAFGIVLLLVPGIILGCMFFVSTPACVAERTGVFESMSRSSFLTKGYRWQVLGTILLLLVAGFVLGAIVGGIFIFTGRIGFVIATQALAAIVGSFNGVLVSVFYYELRVAKEGVDIDKIASVFD
jgi:Uncharacterised protein family (UPF0259)